MAIKEIAVKYTADIKQAESELKRLQKESDRLTKQANQLRVDIKDVERAEQILHEVDEMLRLLQNRRIELRVDTQRANELRERIREVDAVIQRIKDMRLTVQMNHEQIDDAEQITERLNRLLKQAQNYKGNLKVELDSLKEAEAEMKAVDNLFTKLDKQRAKLSVDSSECEQAQQELVETTLKQQELNGQIATVKEELVGDEETLAGLNETMSLMDRINSTAVTIKMVGSGIEKIGNTMLSMVGINGSNPFSFITDTAKFLTKGFGFSALYRLTSKAMNSVEGFVKDAMSRFDTLRNAKYVFEELGYSTEEYDRTIQKLQDNLTGLPTTTDEALSGIQMMVAQLGLEKATDTYIALNDAILGFGGSTDDVYRAVRQLSQSLGKGYIDGETYRSFMNSGLAPVMTKLAEHFGYATDQVGEFKDAIGGNGDSSGRHISTNEFLEALIGMDAEGVEGSFKTLAQKATRGFTSGLRNMKTAITRGFTDILMAGVEVMETEDIPNFFSDAIAKFGKFFENSLKGFANWIRENKEPIKQFFEEVSKKVEDFADALSEFDFGSFLQGLKEGFEWMKPGWEAFKNILSGIKDFVTNLGGGDFSKGIGIALGNWIRIGTTLSLLGKALQLFAKPLATLSVISGGKWSLPNLLSRLFGKSGEMESVVNGAQSFTTAFDAGGALNKLTNLAFITGLIGDLYFLAVAIKKFDESVPADMGETAKKVVSMGEIVAAMGGLVAAAGYLVNEHPDLAFLGELGLLGLAIDLGALGKAIGEFDRNTPTDFKSTSKKVGNMGEVVTAMAILAGALGGVATLSGGLVGGFEIIGIGIILGLATDLAALGKAIGEFDENMPADTAGLELKIHAVNRVIQAIGGATFAQMMTSGFKAGTVDNVKDAMQAMVEIGKAVKEMMGIEIPNVDDVKERINLLDSVVDELSTGTIMKQWGASINKDTVNQVKIAMNSYIEIAKALNEISTLIPAGTDASTFTDSIDIINEVVQSLRKGHGNKGLLQEMGTSWNWGELKKQAKEMSEIVSIYLELANTLNNFNVVDVNPRTFETLFTNISKTMEKLTDIMETDGGTRQKIVDLVSYVSAMNDILKQLSKAVNRLDKVQSSSFDIDGFKAKIADIKEAMGQLIDLKPEGGVVDAVEKMAQIVQSVSNAIVEMQTMSADFKAVGESYADSIYNGFADMNIGHLMEAEIGSAIKTLEGKTSDFKSLGKSYQNAVLDGFSSGMSTGLAGKMANMANTISGYAGSFRSAGITLGQALADGINSATANITVRINGASTSSSSTSMGGRMGAALGRQHGGIVQYLSTGGYPFIPRGTDTIPAMLTPGEFVIRKDAVEKIGLPILERMNSMDIKGMFTMFMENFGAQQLAKGNTVINNVTNNDNRRIDINGDRTSRRGQLTRANRFMKAMAV